MKSTITTAFPPPNNNTGTPDDDMDIDTDNTPGPQRVAPTMRVTNATPDPMAQAGPAQATPVQIIGPISQPIIVSREQATVTQQAPVSAQEKSRQATDGNLVDQESQKAQLMLAAQDGDLPTIQALIFNGANVNATDNDGWTPLMFAALNGHLQTVQALLSAPDIDVNTQHIYGHTALDQARFCLHDDVMKTLLENGANINLACELVKAINNFSDKKRVKSLEMLMNYLAQRQTDVGDLLSEATWASAFATSATPPKASQTVIPPLQSLALDTLVQQTQAEGPSLVKLAFQASRDQLLQRELSATQVVRLINTFSSSPFATALVQTLAVTIKLGGYRTDTEHRSIFNALRISGLRDEYEKNKSRLNSKNINRWQVSGQTLLTRAAQAGDQLLVDALIKCGAALHLPDQHGNNALHAAVKAGKWSVCSHLLACGANPDTSDRSGVSTLTYLAQAFAREDEQTAALVVNLLAPLVAKAHRLDRVVKDRTDSAGWKRITILEILKANLKRYVLYLDLLYSGDVNLADNRGWIPLMYATKEGDLKTLQTLIDKGASVNRAENKGWTPLMFAAERGYLPAVQALLSAPDIDINAQKPDGLTALSIAAIHDKDHAVKVLIDHGAEVNARTHDGRTLLGAVANRGHLPTLNALLSAPGINIDPVSRGLLNSIAIQRYITLKSQALSDEIRNRTNQRRHDLV